MNIYKKCEYCERIFEVRLRRSVRYCSNRCRQGKYRSTKLLYVGVMIIMLLIGCRGDGVMRRYDVELSVSGDSRYVVWYRNREVLGFVGQSFESGDTSRLYLYVMGGGSMGTPYCKLYVDRKVVWEGDGRSVIEQPIIYVFK